MVVVRLPLVIRDLVGGIVFGIVRLVRVSFVGPKFGVGKLVGIGRSF